MLLDTSLHAARDLSGSLVPRHRRFANHRVQQTAVQPHGLTKMRAFGTQRAMIGGVLKIA